MGRLDLEPRPEQFHFVSAGRLAKIALLILAISAVAWMWHSGAYEQLSPERLRASIQSYGLWAPVVFVLSFALLQPLFVSGHLFVFTATLLWPPPLALLLSWMGAVGSALVSFGFARFVARDWVQANLPQRLRRYEERLVERTFRTVLVMRIVLWTTVPMQLMFGAIKLRFAPFLGATLIGLWPGVVFSFVVGTGLIKLILE